ncbi:ImmA/IrrE family metallo-endopeptidase [Rhodocytophaga aerolata]|uniref:ImmA/IrrE family metallo-endopeptidase n=1 Tax=Rhodocytophaga aerolata TaxID=455078 RepID=A0ABT8RBN6_9BACT|nr:ImmA/IrrE family metallo-endopeptidase [Rhodocytophaga aerolata]MDO1449511.1 ImmA/IrrE family metallo-endopeptidase [Rhodocytophaga aerolata]
MSEDIKFTKDNFLRLIMSNIEHNSSSAQRAKEYLTEEGYDVESVVSKGMAKIRELQKQLQPSLPELQKQESKWKNNNYGVSERYWNHPSVKQLIYESQNEDPINEIKSRARDLVFKGFELGWQGPPYDPIALAGYLGFDIIPNDQVIDARIIPKPNSSFQIQYNPQQKQTRVNFSVAHEIAHTLFSDCAQAIHNREEFPVENRQLERLCNAAAAEIQLPYAIFSHDANQAESSMKGLIQLATRYKASLESVFIRYTEVIDKPCAVIIGIFESNNRITLDYYSASKTFPVKLSPGFEIPAESGAFDCFTPGHTAEDTTPWELSNGHRFHASSAGISAYRREKKPRVGILLVPEHLAPTAADERKVIIEFGDATKPRGKGKKIIAQVVNTSGALGSGFGKSLSKNYPKVKEAVQEWKADRSRFILGNTNLVQLDRDLFVFQILAQKGLFPKDNEIPLKYNELRKGLIQLRTTALDMEASIHMPTIGAGHAGGDWNLIIGMIHDELTSYNIKVCIYLLPGKPYNPKEKSNLTVFKEQSTWETKKLF